jgi:hypothetical protein
MRCEWWTLLTGIALGGLTLLRTPYASKGADVKQMDLTDLNQPQSEMRGAIERYVADRGSLNRFSGLLRFTQYLLHRGN